MKVFEIVLMYIVFTITTVDGLLEGHHIPSTEDFINMLNQLNSTFQQSIQKLEESNKKLELANQQLILSNQQLQVEYTTMTKNSSEKIYTFEAELTRMETELSTVKKNSSEKISILEAKLTRMETELSTVKSNTLPAPVAFFATLTTEIGPLGAHQTIPYDRVVINLQHGYDTRHSHFIAPVKGIYGFSVSLMAVLPSYCNIELVKNGDVLLPIHSGSHSDHETGSASVVVSLNACDIVWVRYSSGDVNKLYGDNYNQFSGFLIQNLT